MKILFLILFPAVAFAQFGSVGFSSSGGGTDTVTTPLATSNSASFNGSTQYLTRADNTDVSVGTMDFWIAATVEFASIPSGNRHIVAKYIAAGVNREYMLRYLHGTTSFHAQTVDAGVTDVASVAINVGLPYVGNKYFVMLSYDSTAAASGTLGISVNGSAFTTDVQDNHVSDGTATFVIGSEPEAFGTKWDGKIDNVWLGKRPTSSFAAIRDSLWNSGQFKLPSAVSAGTKTDWGVVSIWSFDSAVTTDDYGSNTLTNTGTVTTSNGLVIR